MPYHFRITEPVSNSNPLEVDFNLSGWVVSVDIIADSRNILASIGLQKKKENIWSA